MVQVAELVKYYNCLNKKKNLSPVTIQLHVSYISIYECEIFYACHILKKKKKLYISSICLGIIYLTEIEFFFY